MTTLDKVIELQKQGMSDSEISTQLQNEGTPPMEIRDSINQAKIKNAVSPSEESEQSPGQEMQASIMPNQKEQLVHPTTQPMTQEMQSQPAMGQTQAPEIYPPQTYSGQPQDTYYQETPQAYSEQDYYAPQGGVDTETISEIAEQVATEKLNEFKRKTGDLVSFKNTTLDKIEDIDDRLKRIEATIDKLQQSIIEKIGEFGENNALVHRDLDNLHGTVSKLMNPLIDNINEMKKISKK